jgi:hypothetical protein
MRSRNNSSNSIENGNVPLRGRRMTIGSKNIITLPSNVKMQPSVNIIINNNQNLNKILNKKDSDIPQISGSASPK